MDRSDYFRAFELNYDIERNEEAVNEITSWLDSDSVMLEKDMVRDIAEYARKRIRQVLRKQNQEFKNL